MYSQNFQTLVNSSEGGTYAPWQDHGVSYPTFFPNPNEIPTSGYFNQNNQVQHWEQCSYRNASPSTSVASSDDIISHYQENQTTQWYQPEFEPNSMSDLIVFRKRQPVPKSQAKITIVRAVDGTTRTIVKRKRKRTSFTTEQVEELERYFSRKPYVNRDDRKVLVEQLKINDKAVKIWFQNRRIKEKREAAESFSGDENIGYDGLAFVESQIKENTDEFGYVNLDSRALDELAKAINEAVLDNTLYETDFKAMDTTDSEASTTCEDVSAEFSEGEKNYEPISPVEQQEDVDEDPVWSLLTPEENLQALLNHEQTVVIV